MRRRYSHIFPFDTDFRGHFIVQRPASMFWPVNEPRTLATLGGPVTGYLISKSSYSHSVCQSRPPEENTIERRIKGYLAGSSALRSTFYLVIPRLQYFVADCLTIIAISPRVSRSPTRGTYAQFCGCPDSDQGSVNKRSKSRVSSLKGSKSWSGFLIRAQSSGSSVRPS